MYGVLVLRNSGGKDSVYLPAYPVRVRQRRVFGCELREHVGLHPPSEDAERTYAHQGAVRLAVDYRVALESACGRFPAVEGARPVPAHVARMNVVDRKRTVSHEAPGEGEGHLGVVRRLPCEGVPYAAVGELPHADGIHAPYRPSVLELDQAPERITRELAEEAPLRPAQHVLWDIARSHGCLSSLTRSYSASSAPVMSLAS